MSIYLIFASTVLFFAFTRTEAGRAELRRQLEQQFAARFEGSLEIGALEGNLVYSFTARNVILRSPDGGIVAVVDTVRALPTWTGILRRSMDFDRIEIRGARVSASRDASGTWNYEEAFRSRRFASDSSTSRTALVIPRVRVVRSFVDVASATRESASRDGASALDFLNARYGISDAAMALDWAGDGRQLDIIRLNGAVYESQYVASTIEVEEISGQIVLDEAGVRINELRLRTPNSYALVLGSIERASAHDSPGPMDLRIDVNRIDPGELTAIFPRQPLRAPVSARVHVSGIPTRFILHEATLARGASAIDISGNVQVDDSVRADLGFRTQHISASDVSEVFPTRSFREFAGIDSVSGELWLQATAPRDTMIWETFSANVQADIESGAGGLAATGFLGRADGDLSFDLNLTLAGVDPQRVTGGRFEPGSLSGSVLLTSSSSRPYEASGRFSLGLHHSRYGTVAFDSLAATVAAVDGSYAGVATLTRNDEQVDANFEASLEAESYDVRVDLDAQASDVGPLLALDSLRTVLDGEATLRWFGERGSRGLEADIRVDSGDVQLNSYRRSVSNADVNVSLASDEDGIRLLARGSLLEAELSTTLGARSARETWPLLTELFARASTTVLPEERAVDCPAGRGDCEPGQSLAPKTPPTGTFAGRLSLASDSTLLSLLLGRDVRLVGAYANVDLVFDSSGVSGKAAASAESLRFSGSAFQMPAAELEVGVPWSVDAQTLSAKASASADVATIGRNVGNGLELGLELGDGTFTGFLSAGDGPTVGPLDVVMRAEVQETAWSASFDRLAISAFDYDVTVGAPHVIFLSRGSIRTPGFSLVSQRLDGGEERLSVAGTYSLADGDTLAIDASGVDLRALSTVLDFSTRLSGSVSGSVDVTRSGASTIAIGNGNVERLGLDGRLLGDLTASSRLRGDRDAVEVQASLRPDRFAGTESATESAAIAVENDLDVAGLIMLPRAGSAGVGLELDVDIRRADLFFFEYVFPYTIDEISGGLAGAGRISGTFAHPIFAADVNVMDGAFTVPELDLDMTLSGEVTVDREAIRLESVLIRDRAGGSATVDGDIRFNDYRYFSLDLEGELDGFQIMNIPNSSELPFYGRIHGSGRVTLDGPISGATLRTINAVTDRDSEIYIPVVEPFSTADQAFIVFADSAGAIPAAGEGRTSVLDPRPSGERTFLDGLELDLNIFAPPGSSVNLVIDPLLGDVMHAVGTGHVQVRRIQGEFSTFGSLQVNSGDYLFTAGDVFVRRFLIDPGGTITWDGDPTNALLDVSASYRTRASRAGLPGSEGTGAALPLIVRLRITGRVTTPAVDLSLEVDRTNRDLSGNYAALEAILNQPSRSTEYATSVLVTNTFLLTTSEASTEVLASSAFNSVSQLVASQLNRYLNEALPNVDFSFGVQGESAQELGVTYGIALRLLDEQLVIRGQGIYQGTRTDATDATYQSLEGEFVVELRLNPTVSVEVFYRREGDVLTKNATLTGSTGAGVSYRTEFSSWRQFFSRIFGTNAGSDANSDS